MKSKTTKKVASKKKRLHKTAPKVEAKPWIVVLTGKHDGEWFSVELNTTRREITVIPQKGNGFNYKLTVRGEGFSETIDEPKTFPAQGKMEIICFTSYGLMAAPDRDHAYLPLQFS